MRGTSESKGNKIKDFDSFDIMFFIYSNKQNALVTRSLPLRPNGRIFLVLMRHFSFSCGNPARPRPGENTAVLILTDPFMVFFNFRHGSVSENLLTSLKRKPKNSEIAKFETDLFKKKDIAPQSHKILQTYV